MVRIEKFENALDVDNEINSFDINIVFYTQYFHNQQALKYLPTCGNTVKQATYALGHINNRALH